MGESIWLHELYMLVDKSYEHDLDASHIGHCLTGPDMNTDPFS